MNSTPNSPLEREAGIILEHEAWKVECEGNDLLADLDRTLNQAKRGLLTNREAVAKFIEIVRRMP
jgi:hypothetical protein